MIYSITLNSNLIRFSKSFYSLIARGKKILLAALTFQILELVFYSTIFLAINLK